MPRNIVRLLFAVLALSATGAWDKDFVEGGLGAVIGVPAR